MSFADVLRYLTIAASGLSAGVLLAFAIGILAVGREMPAGTVIRMKQIVDPRIDRFNPPAVALSAVAGIVLLFVADGMSTAATILDIGGVLGAVGVGATSTGVNMPINREMSRWSPDAPPEEYGPAIRRWGRGHRARTAFAVAGFFCYLTATFVALT